MDDQGFALAELGPKMQACSERERRFVWNYLLNGGNGAQAARDAGYSDVSEAAKVRAHDLMQRDRVLEAIDEVGRKSFRSLLIPVVTATRVLIEKPDHPDHAKTLQSTLDRLGLGAEMRLKVDVDVAINHTESALNDLRMAKAMGASREMLERMFGYSGLERYERMLAELDAKAAGVKLIDGTAERVE